MKKKDVREIITTAVSLFLICAVAAGLLAVVNHVTAPVTAQNRQASENAARAEVLPAAQTFTETTLSDGSTGYVGTDETGAVCGYVFTTSASSYGGKLELMTGFDKNGVVTGIKILSIEDTPGLGMNAKKEDFLRQYIGSDGVLSVIKNAAADKNEIAAITSATITRKAVTSAVNTARGFYDELTGEAA